MFGSSTTTRAARSARAVVGAVSIACFATAAGAADAREDKMPSSYPAYQEMKPADAMKTMDADKNGYVTREEFVKFQEALFGKMDKDGDRRLSAAEFTDRSRDAGG
jgi:hypothetical protein